MVDKRNPTAPRNSGTTPPASETEASAPHRVPLGAIRITWNTPAEGRAAVPREITGAQLGRILEFLGEECDGNWERLWSLDSLVVVKCLAQTLITLGTEEITDEGGMIAEAIVKQCRRIESTGVGGGVLGEPMVEVSR